MITLKCQCIGTPDTFKFKAVFPCSRFYLLHFSWHIHHTSNFRLLTYPSPFPFKWLRPHLSSVYHEWNNTLTGRFSIWSICDFNGIWQGSKWEHGKAFTVNYTIFDGHRDGNGSGNMSMEGFLKVTPIPKCGGIGTFGRIGASPRYAPQQTRI